VSFYTVGQNVYVSSPTLPPTPIPTPSSARSRPIPRRGTTRVTSESGPSTGSSQSRRRLRGDHHQPQPRAFASHRLGRRAPHIGRDRRRRLDHLYHQHQPVDRRRIGFGHSAHVRLPGIPLRPRGHFLHRLPHPTHGGDGSVLLHPSGTSSHLFRRRTDNDGTLQVFSGDEIYVSYTNPSFITVTDQAEILGPCEL
jgi:hypothetical protein